MHKFAIVMLAGLLGGLLTGCAQESAEQSAPAAEAADGRVAAAEARVAEAEARGSETNELLAQGDSEAGKRIYIYCQSCHTINEGGPNKVGPNLYGVFDRPAATAQDFVFSDALIASGVVWTAEALDQWITRPGVLVPGTTMLFAGVNDKQQRADLIAYLQEMSAAQN